MPTEAIPWSTLMPEQRNALIAEKVMGLRIEHWTDKELRGQGEDGEETVCSLRTGYVVPGVYDSERAMNYAFRFPNSELQRSQDAVNDAAYDHESRVVSFEMLRDLRRTMKAEMTNEAQ
jgi:hypothetical protein